MYTNSYNGYVPGADGRPVRLAAKFEWVSKRTNDPQNPFKKIPYIKIFHSGSTDTTHRPVEDRDKLQYPEIWAAFERGQEQDEVGWPIDQVPFLDVAQVDNLKFHGIKTLEALSGAPDQFLDQMMGGKELKRKAIALLKSAADSKPIMELTEKNKTLELEIEGLKRQMAEILKGGTPHQPGAAVKKPGGPKMSQPAVLPESYS